MSGAAGLLPIAPVELYILARGNAPSRRKRSLRLANDVTCSRARGGFPLRAGLSAAAAYDAKRVQNREFKVEEPERTPNAAADAARNAAPAGKTADCRA